MFGAWIGPKRGTNDQMTQILAPFMKIKKANSNVICKCVFILEDGIELS